jgi:hypothetical protein
MAGPGWGGSDPLLRALRAISLAAFLAIFVVVVADPDRAMNLALVAFLAGAILLQLGYDVALRIPDLGPRPKPPEPEREPEGEA